MSNSLCNQSMEIFYECYGAEAGLAALKWLPYGGLYLTGNELCDAMQCYVILCYVMSSYALQCNVMSCQVMLYSALLHYPLFFSLYLTLPYSTLFAFIDISNLGLLASLKILLPYAHSISLTSYFFILFFHFFH
jgi:Glucokinase